MRTYEGPDIESVLAEVREREGARARILSAKKERKGGVAGFFSKEVFVVTVEEGDEPIAAPNAWQPLVNDDDTSLLVLADATSERERQAITLSAPSASQWRPRSFDDVLANAKVIAAQLERDLAVDLTDAVAELARAEPATPATPTTLPAPEPAAKPKSIGPKPKSIGPKPKQIPQSDPLPVAEAVASPEPEPEPVVARTRRGYKLRVARPAFADAPRLERPAPTSFAAAPQGPRLAWPDAPVPDLATPGIIAILGTVTAATAAARRLTDHFFVASRHVPGGDVPRWLWIPDSVDARARSRRWTNLDRALVVAVESSLELDLDGWTAAVLDGLSPTHRRCAVNDDMADAMRDGWLAALVAAGTRVDGIERL